ncbi:MAG: molecular chaperone [Thermoplasmata archaeon]
MKESDRLTRIEQAKARVKIYRLLSRIYLKPIDPTLTDLLGTREYGLSLRLQPLGEVSGQIIDGFSEIGESLRKIQGDDPKESHTVLSATFTKLFRGVKRTTSPPPPYESLYRSGAETVFGGESLQVRQEYRRFGLTMAQEYGGEPPDHISFELDFMAYLCSLEADAWSKENPQEASRLLKAQKRFLEEHLLRWIPKFCSNIRKADKTGLYKGFADLTEGWVHLDLQQIQQSLQNLDT